MASNAIRPKRLVICPIRPISALVKVRLWSSVTYHAVSAIQPPISLALCNLSHSSSTSLDKFQALMPLARASANLLEIFSTANLALRTRGAGSSLFISVSVSVSVFCILYSGSVNNALSNSSLSKACLSR